MAKAIVSIACLKVPWPDMTTSVAPPLVVLFASDKKWQYPSTLKESASTFDIYCKALLVASLTQVEMHDEIFHFEMFSRPLL